LLKYDLVFDQRSTGESEKRKSSGCTHAERDICIVLPGSKRFRFSPASDYRDRVLSRHERDESL